MAHATAAPNSRLDESPRLLKPKIVRRVGRKEDASPLSVSSPPSFSSTSSPSLVSLSSSSLSSVSSSSLRPAANPRRPVVKSPSQGQKWPATTTATSQRPPAGKSQPRASPRGTVRSASAPRSLGPSPQTSGSYSSQSPTVGNGSFDARSAASSFDSAAGSSFYSRRRRSYGSAEFMEMAAKVLASEETAAAAAAATGGAPVDRAAQLRAEIRAAQLEFERLSALAAAQAAQKSARASPLASKVRAGGGGASRRSKNEGQPSSESAAFSTVRAGLPDAERLQEVIKRRVSQRRESLDPPTNPLTSEGASAAGLASASRVRVGQAASGLPTGRLTPPGQPPALAGGPTAAARTPLDPRSPSADTPAGVALGRPFNSSPATLTAAPPSPSPLSSSLSSSSRSRSPFVLLRRSISASFRSFSAGRSRESDSGKERLTELNA